MSIAASDIAKIYSADNFNEYSVPEILYINPAGTRARLEMGIVDSHIDSQVLVPYRTVPNTPYQAGSGVCQYFFHFTEREMETLCGRVASNSAQFTIVLKTYIGSDWGYDTQKVTFTIKNKRCQFDTDIVDINPKTVALTGDLHRMILSESNMEFRTTVKMPIATRVLEWTVTNGSNRYEEYIPPDKPAETEFKHLFLHAESPEFTINVKDDRFNHSEDNYIVDAVPYFKPSCAITSEKPDTRGQFYLTIEGNCYKGNFGKKENKLVLKYRHKEEGHDLHSPWIIVQPTWNSDGSYFYEKLIDNLDYQKSYQFEAELEDELNTINTNVSVKTTPVFDWGKNDFNFNVPVHFNQGATGIQNGETASFLPSTGGTLTGDLRIQSAGTKYGNKLNFGDGNYTYLQEKEDDNLTIHSTYLNLEGMISLDGNKFDYGVFTPTLQNVRSYSNQDGYYIKIGKMVLVTFNVSGQFSNYQSIKNEVLYIHIPFTPEIDCYGSGVCYNAYIPADNVFLAWAMKAGSPKMTGRTGSQKSTAGGSHLGTAVYYNPGAHFSFGGMILIKNVQ